MGISGKKTHTTGYTEAHSHQLPLNSQLNHIFLLLCHTVTHISSLSGRHDVNHVHFLFLQLVIFSCDNLCFFLENYWILQHVRASENYSNKTVGKEKTPLWLSCSQHIDIQLMKRQCKILHFKGITSGWEQMFFNQLLKIVPNKCTVTYSFRDHLSLLKKWHNIFVICF